MSRVNTKRPRRRYQGHPARVAAKKAQQGPPDARELEIRELVRLVRREAAVNGEEGALVGPLGAAAKRAAELLCERVPGLGDEEHVHAVANYLTERLGEVIDGFDVVEYRDWRQRCVADAGKAAV